MANNWAIAIGINQYQFFQPLGCAQADAEAVKDFLVTEGGFNRQQCLLMTDTSPLFEDKFTYPTKENILRWLEDLTAVRFKPQDRLWFFFSGYGVNHKGQDYLMPVEGDPSRIEETGVEIRILMQSFQVAGLDALLLFDMNRASGTKANALVGKETLELAKELQIPTILSCQPEQFSYESMELGHGFFTAALLEALRYGNGSTLTNLERYLSDRTPELGQHYWRPLQNPFVVSASKEQIILPLFEEKRDKKRASPIESTIELEESAPVVIVQAPCVEVKAAGKQEKQGSREVDGEIAPVTSHKNTSFLPKLLLGSTATMLVLCVVTAVLLWDRVGLKLTEILPASSKTAVTTDKEVATTSSTPPSTTTAPTAPSTLTPLEPPPPPTMSLASSASSPPPPPPTIQVTPSPDNSTKQNQALLDLKKMSLDPDQASDLRLAIINARKLKSDESGYEQAQENIQVWNRMILEVAENRAEERQYAGAIAAAELIAKNEPQYSQAQADIKKWRLEAKQYMTNTTLIDAAVGLIRTEQASSYNRAIEVAKKVPSGQPGFDIATKSIDTWSEKIFDIAERRASKGNMKAAIETATLVPEGTAAYKDAQEAIQKWQQSSQQSKVNTQ
ncbi:MAG: caspase family protein [Scytonema sp. PMC 1069.18]|nr:caspase family protein [Scytonema sp. PMC 1069.18]MEC4886059.1 caspase family protein [Scytonema sp. PMC 1070.18]